MKTFYILFSLHTQINAEGFALQCFHYKCNTVFLIHIIIVLCMHVHCNMYETFRALLFPAVFRVVQEISLNANTQSPGVTITLNELCRDDEYIIVVNFGTQKSPQDNCMIVDNASVAEVLEMHTIFYWTLLQLVSKKMRCTVILQL